MATALERPRRNLFLPKIFMIDCLALDLNESGESNEAEDVMTKMSTSGHLEVKPKDPVEDEIDTNSDDDVASEDFIDDLEEDLDDDLGNDTIIEQPVSKPSPKKPEKIESDEEDEGEAVLPNLYDGDTAANYEHTSSDYIEQYDIIPKWFINVETWVKSTNLDCWYCDCKNPGFPWFIPLTKMRKCVPCDPATGKIIVSESMNVSDAALLNLNSNKRYREVDAMKTLGHFCSPCCAKTYLERVNDSRIINNWQSNTLLKALFKTVTGKSIGDIPEAVSKTEMIQYCGPIDGITSKEYRILNEKRLEEYLNSNFQS